MTGILSHGAPTLPGDGPDYGSCSTGAGAETPHSRPGRITLKSGPDQTTQHAPDSTASRLEAGENRFWQPEPKMPIMSICRTAARPAPILSHPAVLPANARNCRGQPLTAPDRMDARTRGKRWQNSPPPHESTSSPARSIASHKGSADRTRSSAVAASTSSTAHTSATTSRREAAGRSASESRSMVKRYAVLLRPSSSAANRSLCRSGCT